MADKKFDPQNPKTQEELKELVKITKQRLKISSQGIQLKDKELNQPQDAVEEISFLKKLIRSINKVGPQKISNFINQSSNKKLN